MKDVLNAKQNSSSAIRVGERLKMIAFYLPQFHPIPENDRWWGEGFTEWTNVTKTKPLFEGHVQPKLPGQLGFYDLRLLDVQEKQAALARAFGIDAFCYYLYWFNGKRLLETPLNNAIRSGRPDHPFCVCWANESWTRSWDGLNKHVLMEQDYSEASLQGFANLVLEYFRDSRYLRHGGKPILVIYRLEDIPDYRGWIERWRTIWRESGVGEVHLCAVRFHSDVLPQDPSEAGVDAFVEFPPHGARIKEISSEVRGLPKEFNGLIYSYYDVVEDNLERHVSSETKTLHRGLMLGWDNTARRGLSAHICHGASPVKFRYWLRGIAEQEIRKRPGDSHLVFVNAWNEWAEGTYLEPDSRFGLGYLEAVRSVRDSLVTPDSL